jgi:hypothetical protein
MISMIALLSEAVVCEAALAVSRSSDGLSSAGLRGTSEAMAIAPVGVLYKARMAFVRSSHNSNSSEAAL